MKNKVPTLQELKEKVKKENIEFNDDYEIDEHSTLAMLKLLENNFDYFEFLEEKNFEHYELPTVVSDHIRYYVDTCLTKNKIDKLVLLYNYLEDLITEWDSEIINTIQVWFLEIIAPEDFENHRVYMKDKLWELYDGQLIYGWPGWNDKFKNKLD